MSNFLLTVLETETNNKLLLIFQKSDHTDFTSDHFFGIAQCPDRTNVLMRTFAFSDQFYLSDSILNKNSQIFVPQFSEDLNFDSSDHDSVAVSIFRFFQVRSDELTPFFGMNNVQQNVDVYVRKKMILKNVSDLNTEIFPFGLATQDGQNFTAVSCVILSKVVVTRRSNQLRTQINFTGNLPEIKQMSITYWQSNILVATQRLLVNGAFAFITLSNKNAAAINKVVVEIFYVKNPACKDTATILLGSSGGQFTLPVSLKRP